MQIPWVFCPVFPLAMLSIAEPPLFPYLWRMQRSFRHSELVQGLCIQGVRGFAKLMMRRNIAFQKRLGIWDGKHPRFEGLYSQDLNLLMTSDALVRQCPDWPPNTYLPGFAWFDPLFMDNDEQNRKFDSFLEKGDAPVVIAPGGSVRVRPGSFFKNAIDATLSLGLRAVVVAGKKIHDELQINDPRVLVCGYMPYSKLLKNARLLIHSGGIGAIGWAVRSGIPSLIVPAEWDQFDNAEIAEKANIACVEWSINSDAGRMAAKLRYMLQDMSINSAVKAMQRDILGIDGAFHAVQSIAKLLGEPNISYPTN
jgi:UDP:flavonoid glycosyltransferase YjiC (YdhE family)